MNIKEFYKSRDGNLSLSKNFKVSEFACNDGSDKLLIDLDMIPILQTIRDIGGKVTINSAYRTQSHNKAVGGAMNSYHLKGRAFDIVSEKLSITNICDLANTLGVKGIIKYPTFVHIDSRANKYHADNKGNRLEFNYYEYTALDYLADNGRITDRALWLKELNKNPNLKWLIIKWSKDVRDLTSNK